MLDTSDNNDDRGRHSEMMDTADATRAVAVEEADEAYIVHANGDVEGAVNRPPAAAAPYRASRSSGSALKPSRSWNSNGPGRRSLTRSYSPPGLAQAGYDTGMFQPKPSMPVAMPVVAGGRPVLRGKKSGMLWPRDNNV